VPLSLHKVKPCIHSARYLKRTNKSISLRTNLLGKRLLLHKVMLITFKNLNIICFEALSPPPCSCYEIVARYVIKLYLQILTHATKADCLLSGLERFLWRFCCYAVLNNVGNHLGQSIADVYSSWLMFMVREYFYMYKTLRKNNTANRDF